jgi:hypothetical protein
MPTPGPRSHARTRFRTARVLGRRQRPQRDVVSEFGVVEEAGQPTGARCQLIMLFSLTSRVRPRDDPYRSATRAAVHIAKAPVKAMLRLRGDSCTGRSPSGRHLARISFLWDSGVVDDSGAWLALRRCIRQPARSALHLGRPVIGMGARPQIADRGPAQPADGSFLGNVVPSPSAPWHRGFHRGRSRCPRSPLCFHAVACPSSGRNHRDAEHPGETA